MSPRVSVVMAVKDYPDLLPESMASILSQTARAIEFVIVDYGSTDDSLYIINSWADLRVRLIIWPGLTFTEALNVGVAIATGKYIARQDADDYSLPKRLSTQARFLDENLNIDVLGTGYKTVDPRSFDYDEQMHCAQDYGLYLKVMHNSVICHVIPDVLYIRFHTPGCVTERRRKQQMRAVAYAKERYGQGHSWRHNRIRAHAEAYWRGRGLRKVYEFIMVALYDPMYWSVEYRKARARRPV